MFASWHTSLHVRTHNQNYWSATNQIFVSEKMIWQMNPVCVIRLLRPTSHFPLWQTFSQVCPNILASVTFGCAWPTEGAHSSGILVLSHVGLAFVLMLTPFILELVMSTDLLSFEHPSVLLFWLYKQLFNVKVQRNSFFLRWYVCEWKPITTKN